MDLPPSANGFRFQAPTAVGQLLPSARIADLSEDGEIFDSNNNDDDDEDDDDDARSVLHEADLALLKAGKAGV